MSHFGKVFGAIFFALFIIVAYQNCAEDVNLDEYTDPSVTKKDLANGAVCDEPTDCLSNTCAVGPEAKKYCLAAAANCPQPGGDGILFNAGYVYNGNSYVCQPNVGLTQIVPRACMMNGVSYPHNVNTPVSVYASPAGCGVSVCAPPVNAYCVDGTFRNGSVAGNIIANPSATCAKEFCDARTVPTGTISGLKPGKPYLLNVLGRTLYRTDGAATLRGIRVTSCVSPYAVILSNTSKSLDWADGSVPQSSTFAVTAPADGCLRATDDSAYNSAGTLINTSTAIALNLTAVEMPIAGVNLTYQANVGLVNTAFTVGKNYFYSISGVTASRGTGTASLLSTEALDCNNGNVLAGTDPANNILWPDGQAPISYSMKITPTSSCVRARIDGSTINTIGDNRTAAPLNGAFFEYNGALMDNVDGGQINNLIPGKKYLITMHGYLPVPPSSTNNLYVARVFICNTATQLAFTNSVPNGSLGNNTPITASLVVTAPAGGCIQNTLSGSNSGVVLNSSWLEIN
jgi:hypothetical protein